MNGFKAEPFNSDYMLVKAETIGFDKDKILCGFYSTRRSEKGQEISYIKVPTKDEFWEINPYTVCRNSGIKDKKGKYIFEYDLLKLTHGLETSRYGFIVWDEFYKSWKIRCRTDRTAYQDIEKWTIEVVGNIILSDANAEIIYKQEKEEDAKGSFIDNSYCPSKFRK